MIRAIPAAITLDLSLSACNTRAPNRLSALETADLRFVSLEVRAPEKAKMVWSDAEDEYAGGPAANLMGQPSPEVRAFVHDLAARRVKAALERVTAKRPVGGRPVRLVAAILSAGIPSPARRVIIGRRPQLEAEIDLHTNAVLTSCKESDGQFAGEGVGGVILDAMMVEAGVSTTCLTAPQTASGAASTGGCPRRELLFRCRDATG